MQERSAPANGTVTGPDFNTAARFIAESVAHARKLAAQQRPEAAQRVVLGLHSLVSTIRSAQAEHGFSAELVLAGEFAMLADLGGRYGNGADNGVANAQ